MIILCKTSVLAPWLILRGNEVWISGRWRFPDSSNSGSGELPVFSFSRFFPVSSGSKSVAKFFSFQRLHYASLPSSSWVLTFSFTLVFKVLLALLNETVNLPEKPYISSQSIINFADREKKNFLERGKAGSRKEKHYHFHAAQPSAAKALSHPALPFINKKLRSSKFPDILPFLPPFLQPFLRMHSLYSCCSNTNCEHCAFRSLKFWGELLPVSL